MTPQPHTPERRVSVRRPVALVAAVLAIAGTPLVANALDRNETSPPAPSARRSATTIAGSVSGSVESDPVSAATPEQPSVPPATDVDPVIVLLADTYAWDEHTARVAVLQANLGLDADARYGQATQQAHRKALEFVGLPTDTLPTAPLPPGPSPEEWEALRQCESNGNYSITNPSGKYRGAYQFDRPTWNSVAERHAPHLVGVDPAAAAPADQDFLARALYSERGARPWPQCGRHLS